MMRTTIALENLCFHARHGVLEQERTVGNTFVVTLRLDYPFEDAMMSDKLESTLNYAEAYDVVKAEMTVPSRLLEHVAGRIRTSLIQKFPKITGGFIRIEKCRPPIAGITGSAAIEVAW